VARDAIARQFDVEKNTVKIEAEGLPSQYQPGTITFYAKKGKSIDIEKLHDSLRATRLSGSTNMQVTSFDITATGEVKLEGTRVILKVAGTGQELELADTGGRIASALQGGANVKEVTGRLDGWNAKFPVVLRQVPMDPETKRMKLTVTGFRTGK
jgi:hypothetical protein